MNQVPMPGDMMVGSYFPWLEQKWGYTTGVPVKNPLTSDVFSASYLWKQVVSESIKSGQWPLWNPYSYSGYPLLANLQSGVMHPFNFLFVILGQINGWSAWMILSILGETLGMYWFLRVLKKSEFASVIGAIAFGFSGFSILWNQFVGANVAMMWWPVGLGLIEKFFETKNKKYLWWFPLIVFLIIAAGHFQICIYTGLLFLSYFLWKWSKDKIKIEWKFWLVLGILTVIISLPQILPVAEMGKMSVRFDEGYIEGYNYGLLPVANLITLLAPDFFGNPTTYNYWGFFNYLETNFYVGVIGLLALIWGVYNFKKLGNVKYFLVVAIVALLMGFDTPIGKLMYWLKIPGLSTSAAGRIASVFVFAMAVITADFAEELAKIKWKSFIRFFWSIPVTIGVVVVILLILKNKFGVENNPIWVANMMIGLRNMVLPVMILGGFLIIFTFRKFRIAKVALMLLIILDLFRFGWKWTPFVDKKMIFPTTPEIDFLDTKGGELYRVEREKGELFPPNVWSAYHIMSPSGYDPMSSKEYVTEYEKRVNLNNWENPGVSRYLELNKYNAKGLGDYNVKYLWVLKRDKDNKIFGDKINSAINMTEWKKVKETTGTVLLENLKFKPRVSLVDNNGIENNEDIYIDDYTNNVVKIKFISDSDNEKVVLRDSWYPGWKAYVNGNKVKVEKFDSVFRSVTVPKGIGEIKFVYLPNSFILGLIAAGMGLLVWTIGLFRLKKTELR